MKLEYKLRIMSTLYHMPFPTADTVSEEQTEAPYFPIEIFGHDLFCKYWSNIGF